LLKEEGLKCAKLIKKLGPEDQETLSILTALEDEVCNKYAK